MASNMYVTQLGESFEYITNLPHSRGSIRTENTSSANLRDLPLRFYEKNNMRLSLTNPREISYISSLRLTREEAVKLERDTVKQSECDLWFEARKGRLTSSHCRQVVTKKDPEYQSLCRDILNPTPFEELPSYVQEGMNYGLMYEPTARALYTDVMNSKLGRRVSVRETGIVIQPSLSWLGASPDGLVIDGSSEGLIEIKCPASKKHLKPSQLVEDSWFYVGYECGSLALKKTHRNGYYSQIQLAMGLAGARFCDFIVYTFKGLIIVRTEFDEDYFDNLLGQLKPFYKHHLLPQIVSNNS